MTDQLTPGDVIRQWCDAVTNGDLARVRRLVNPDIRFHGPRGTGSGADMVVEWVERSGIHIEPVQVTWSDGRAIANCVATWPDPDSQTEKHRTLPQETKLTFRFEYARIADIWREDAAAPQG